MVAGVSSTVASSLNLVVIEQNEAGSNEKYTLINGLNSGDVYNNTTELQSSIAPTCPGSYKIVFRILGVSAGLGLMAGWGAVHLLREGCGELQSTNTALGNKNAPLVNDGFAVTPGHGVMMDAEFTVLGLIKSSLEYGDVQQAVELTLNDVQKDPHFALFAKRLSHFVQKCNKRNKRTLTDDQLRKNDQDNLEWIARLLKHPNNLNKVKALLDYDFKRGIDLGLGRGYDGIKEGFHRIGKHRDDARTYGTPKSKTPANSGAMALFWSLLSRNNAHERVGEPF